MRTILIMLALFLGACTVTPPLVGYANFNGTGDVRTDGITLVAFGDIEGVAGVFAKGSGFPMTIPFAVQEGRVFLRTLEDSWTQPITEPLPSWCRELIPPGHQEVLEGALGVTLTFD